MTISWSCSCISFVKFCCKKSGCHNMYMTMLYPNLWHNKACYKGTRSGIKGQHCTTVFPFLLKMAIITLKTDKTGFTLGLSFGHFEFYMDQSFMHK